VVLILYTALAVEFLLRFTLDRPTQRIRDNGVVLPRGAMKRPITFMLIGLSVMVVLLLTRSIYRLIELSDGWTGTVISTQWLFGLFACPLHSWTEMLITKQACLTVPWFFWRCSCLVCSTPVYCFVDRTKSRRTLMTRRRRRTRQPRVRRRSSS